LALLPLPAFADDASNGVMLPGLQSSPTGSLRVLAANVVLRADKLAVSLTTEDRLGVPARISIHGPRFGWLGEAEPYPDRQFPEFAATLDGTPLTLTSDFSAFVGSTEISALLRDAQLDPFVIAETPPFVSAVAGHEVAFNKLVALGAIQKSDDDALAQWEAARTIGMTLGKPGEHTLAWRYTVRPAYALMSFHQVAATVPLTSYCLSSAALARRLAHATADRSFVVRQYAVPVGMDGRPVAHVMVNIAAAPSALVAFCGSNGTSMIGRASEVSPARTDALGVVHILTIGGNAN
jgi:hypothetical protein